MEALTRQQIFDAPDREMRRVDVPEWGGYVYIKPLSAFDKDKYEQGLVETNGENRTVNLMNSRAKLVALACVDADGSRIFGDVSDVLRLGQKSAIALDRIVAAVRLDNGIGREAQDAIEKKCAATVAGDSTIV